MTFPTACTSTPAHNAGASAYSRFVQRIRRRYAQQLPLLPEGAPLRPAMQATLDALLASGLETGAALRQLRQLVLERLVVLDVTPTLPTACGSLPPEGALRLRPGEAGSAAPAGGCGGDDPALAAGAPTLSAAHASLVPEGQNPTPTLPTSCGSLPPEGALRLRPGKARSAAPAGGEGKPPRTP